MPIGEFRGPSRPSAALGDIKGDLVTCNFAHQKPKAVIPLHAWVHFRLDVNTEPPWIGTVVSNDCIIAVKPMDDPFDDFCFGLGQGRRGNRFGWRMGLGHSQKLLSLVAEITFMLRYVTKSTPEFTLRDLARWPDEGGLPPS